MFEILNSQAHLLNEKGRSRAGALHQSGVEARVLSTAAMMEESTLAETVRTMTKVVRVLVLTRLEQTFPDVNLSLMVSMKTLEPFSQAKGTAMSMVKPFSQAEGITMIVIDHFSQAIVHF